MKKHILNILLSLIVLVGVFGLLGLNASAKTQSITTHHSAPKIDPRMQVAQTHLQNLGYYTAKIDGIYGPKTMSALMEFQKQHNLKTNGKLTNATYKALAHADVNEPPKKVEAEISAEVVATEKPPAKEDFYKTHPDFYGYYNSQYANAMMMGPPSIQSRYAHIDVHEKTSQGYHSYDVIMNNQPLFSVDEQASIIGISRTYALGDEDAIIFTSYRATSNVCSYRHYLLTVKANSNQLREIESCSRGYQANVVNGTLMVVFSEDGHDAAPSTWRYDNGALTKL